MKSNMKFLTICLSTALLASAAMAQAKPAASQPALPPSPTVTGPSKLAFIDFQEAIGRTAEGKKLMDGLQARYAPARAELDSGAKAVQALQKQLADGGSTMSAQAKASLTQQIQRKQRDLQQTAQDDQTNYQTDLTSVLNQVGNKMVPIITAYAKEHGYTAVVDSSLKWPQSPVLWVESGTDITGDVVRLYDQKNPQAAAKP